MSGTGARGVEELDFMSFLMLWKVECSFWEGRDMMV